MRFSRKATIMLSEDDSTSPKDIRFHDLDRETLDRASIVEGGSATHAVDIGDTFTLPMGQISQGKYFYLYADGPFELNINGVTGAELSMAGDVVNEMWCDFTTLTVENLTGSADDIRLTWVIGGV